MPKTTQNKKPVSATTRPPASSTTDTSGLAGKIFLKATLLSLFFTFIMLFLTAVGVGFYAWSRFGTFAKTAQTTRSQFIETLKLGWEETVIADNNHKNFLILGVDTLANRGDIPPLTDTMILLSLNLENGKIITLPLPRDLWLEDYKTKINALYYYGIDRYPENPEQFPTEVISELTQVPIHHTVVLSLDNLEELIDLAGGVSIDIEEGFTDTEFPRTDVDVTVVRDPALLYESVTFDKGTEIMTGERALKYIRSRHSGDDQGTDLARGQRQQQVIQALMVKLMDPQSLIKNPELAGQLYHFYQENFEDSLSLTQLIATTRKLLPLRENISLEGQNISAQPDDIDGVLINPPLWQYQNQWVYVISDLERFREEVGGYLDN